MRLGVITTSYPRHRDDPAGSFVAGLARALVVAGHEVEVLAAAGEEPEGPPDPEAGDQPRVTRVHTGAELFYDEGAPDRLGRSWAMRARAPLFTAALAARATLHARRWDAVLSHWLVPSGLAAAATRRPHLAIAHSGDVHLVARGNVADATMGALLAGGPLHVSFVGAHLRDRLLAALRAPLRRALVQRSDVMPMGVDARALGSLRPVVPDPVRGRPLIAFIGRLVPIKGVDILLEAVAQLGRPAQLTIAGAGPLRVMLERRAAELAAAHEGLSIRFAGEVRGGARDAIHAAADVLVLPSVDLPGGRTEGTPVVAIEAMATGVPLVASDVGGVREVVGQAALLVPPGDPAALAAALRVVLDDHPATCDRVRAGRELGRALDWPVIARRVGDRLAQLDRP
jgi:glycosyltransferase involved in cell wall biosynthesis